MKTMTGNELRRKFLDFFATKDHLVQPSYSLIPDNDPSLLLIGAGMAPFKPFFTGKMKPPHPRIATCQKCVRTGDIENVGHTARHHTFFEMLGNFSFGDYFKNEAIAWAWEFVTEHLGLPADRLWVTIHTKDDEAFLIWRDAIGVPPERIVRMEDNFWEIGPGPCGPCSEIYIDLGPERGCGKPSCGVGCNCDRYLEIWNLVFTQFDRSEAGEYTPLAKKNIDTGAGLERIASVLQGKKSNFETDLLFPIIAYTAKIAGVEYGTAPKTDISLKVIADHGRSMVVMVADGVLPSNEGRGYVLRRILRRAVRHARLLGIERPFLAGIVDVVADIFAEPYPEIRSKAAYIKQVVGLEEQRFESTLVQGMEILNGYIEDLRASERKVLTGTAAFKLYDTYGFPWELTQEILRENGFDLDKAGFDAAMNEQRERARAARSDLAERTSLPDLSGLVTEKLKYDREANQGKVMLLFREGVQVKEIHDGQDGTVILDVTSFYAEGGGQVGDTGSIAGPLGQMEVVSTKKLPDGTICHLGRVTEGTISVGDMVSLIRDEERCRATARNHTATHLLHAALKTVLGSHVNQAGSYVGPDRLRFDFTHFAAVSPDELSRVETIVNEAVMHNLSVSAVEMPREKAKEMGAIALFGEKYGEIVRVVSIGDFSRELCGGTHVRNTGEIGLFRIIGESSVGSGLRRIEALTGTGALSYVAQREALLAEAASLLKTRPDDIVQRIEAVQARIRELEKAQAAMEKRLMRGQVEELFSRRQKIGEVTVIAGEVSVQDMEELRAMADAVRDRLECGVVLLSTVTGDKVQYVAMATPSAVKAGVHAGEIVKEAARVAGGGGGGRPDMAQAGGRRPEKAAEGIASAIERLRSSLS